MGRILSPLRYPGSKARLSRLVAYLLEKNQLVGSHLYEPFVGGGSISLHLLASGFIRSATWVERDPLIYAFWQSAKDNPDALIEKVGKIQITLRTWKRLQSLRDINRPPPKRLLELGCAGLFFNRTCFSGIVGAGPIGGMSQNSPYKIDCRFNKQEIAKSIKAVAPLLQKIDVRFGDGIYFLEKQCLEMMRHSFAYIDPPYVSNGHKLYRYFFSSRQHQQLSRVIAKLDVPWLLSYDNHPYVRKLYGPVRASRVSIYQSLKGARLIDELLILSPDFELTLPKKTKYDDYADRKQVQPNPNELA